MEANVTVRWQQEGSNTQERPFLSTLPLHPQQAYKALPSTKRQVVKKTERIPFSSLRELILAYSLQDEPIIDLPASDLFLEKRGSLTAHEQSINKVIDYWLKEAARLQALNSAATRYVALRTPHVSSSALKDSRPDIDFSEELRRKAEQLQRGKDERARQLGSKDLADKENSKSLLDFILNKKTLLQEQAQGYQTALSELSQLKILSSEFEKTLTIILAARHPDNPNPPRPDENTLSRLPETAQTLAEQISAFTEQQQSQLFQWRMLVKHEQLLDGKQPPSAETQGAKLKKETEAKGKQLEERLQKELYEQLAKIIGVVQRDKAECEKREAEVSTRWSRFLPGYCNAREVLQYCQNPTEVQEVIQGEKKRLETHLKTNSGLMVPYTPSEEYAAFADKHLNKRSYLKILIEERVQFLEKAINYVNKDYPALYALACSNRASEARPKIDSKRKEFQRNLQQPIAVFVMESVRQLFTLLR